jgi:curved DNA-binding protein CbpA
MLRCATSSSFRRHGISPFRCANSANGTKFGFNRKSISTSRTLKATYYEILGIETTSNGGTITEAYRKRAMEWHPDRNKAQDAKEKFVLAQQAYAVLRDPKKRQEYDKTLEQTLYGGKVSQTGHGATVVRRRTNRTYLFLGLFALVLLWYKWNTFVPGTEDDSYLRNPREYFQNKNAKEIEE